MEIFKKEIFEHLGRVFYAIASEQDISVLASGELKMLFRKEWLSTSPERLMDKVPEPAHLIGLKIDSLLAEQASPSEAFAEFEEYYIRNEEQVSIAFKQQILETADMILKTFPTPGKRNVYAERLKKLVQRSMERTESGQ